MPIRVTLALLGLCAWASPAAAQGLAGQPETARSEIRATLRAFYYNLAHHDWDALTADILAAKVVAHRAPPEALSSSTVLAGGNPISCTGGMPLVDSALATLEGEWAEATVPHCGAISAVDEFRLIRFEGRWRFVSIRLYSPSASVLATPR